MVEWRTRKRGKGKQVGTRFPILPRGDKKNLPKSLKLASIPEHSKLDKARAEEETETPEDELESEESSEVEEDKILEAGIEELRERGLELGVDYDLTDGDDLEIPVKSGIKRKRKQSTESSEEIPDYAEIKRRERALKRHARSLAY